MNLVKSFRFFQTLRKARRDALGHPYKLFYVVTKRCQSRCQNCKIWREEIKDELSLSEVTTFIRKNPYFSWINLTGGELSLRDDIHEVVDVLIQNSPNLYLFNFATNALDPEAVISLVKKISTYKIPYVAITVSLDGPEKLHDALRGVKGNFKKAVQTLGELRRVKGIHVYAGMTLYEKNLESIEETYAAIREVLPDFHRSELHLNLPNVSDHFYGNTEKTSSDLNGGIEIIRDWNRRKRKWGFSPFLRMEKIFLDEAEVFLATAKTPVPCQAVKSTLYLSESGEVYPCVIWGKKLGSIRESNYDLGPILRGALGKSTREEICEGKCPQCWTACEAYPALMEKPGVLF